jgi:hypothetical protein
MHNTLVWLHEKEEELHEENYAEWLKRKEIKDERIKTKLANTKEFSRC